MALPTNLNKDIIVLGATANSISESVNTLLANYGFTTTVASASTIVLTATSVPAQFVTEGDVAQTIQLPNATTLQSNQSFIVYNQTPESLTLTYNDTTSFLTLPSIDAGLSYVIQVTNKTTTNGVWKVQILQPVATSTVPGIQTFVNSGTANMAFTPVDASGAELVFTNNSSFYSENGNIEVPNFSFTYPESSDTSDASFTLTDVAFAHGNIPFIIVGDNGVIYLGKVAAGTNVVTMLDTNANPVTNDALSLVTLTATLSYAV